MGEIRDSGTWHVNTEGQLCITLTKWGEYGERCYFIYQGETKNKNKYTKVLMSGNVSRAMPDGIVPVLIIKGKLEKLRSSPTVKD